MEEWIYRDRRLLDLLQLLLKKFIFYRSVLAQVTGTEHDASEAVSIAFALPLERSSRSFAAPEPNPSAMICPREMLEEVSWPTPGGYTHLHPSCQLHIKYTHKLAATGFPAARVQQISSRKETAKFTEQEGSQTCLEFRAILWLYWHLKVTKLTVLNFLAHSSCFYFPYLMSSLKINEHLLHW